MLERYEVAIKKLNNSSKYSWTFTIGKIYDPTAMECSIRRNDMSNKSHVFFSKNDVTITNVHNELKYTCEIYFHKNDDITLEVVYIETYDAVLALDVNVNEKNIICYYQS